MISGRPHHRGFTLIELLVVLGIISLLLAIMLPSMTAARREARRVVCQSNLKQIAAGWRAYLEESKGYFPRLALADINFGGRQGMDTLYRSRKPLNKHLGLPLSTQSGAEIFRCPDDRGGLQDPNVEAKAVADSFFEHYGTSYFTNSLLIGASPVPIGSRDPCYKMTQTFESVLPYVPAGQFDFESKLVLVGDAPWFKAWNYSNLDPVVSWHGVRSKYNIGFMDGHADFVLIRKGMYVTSQYTVLPTRSLQDQAMQCQEEPK